VGPVGAGGPGVKIPTRHLAFQFFQKISSVHSAQRRDAQGPQSPLAFLFRGAFSSQASQTLLVLSPRPCNACAQGLMVSKIFNERGEFGAKAHITDDVPPGVVWMRGGWFGLNHLTYGYAVLTGGALSLFTFFGWPGGLWRWGRDCSRLRVPMFLEHLH